jgi:hypothetical protein
MRYEMSRLGQSIMLIKKLSLLLLFSAASAAGYAQQMYKTVGPDGKITFSDRPDIKADTKVSVMRRYSLHSIDPVASKPGTDAKAAPRTPAKNAGAPVITPEIEDAMLTVMGLSEFGRRFDGFCSDTPQLARAFATANYDWKKRNAAAVEQQKQLLNQVLSPAKRSNLIDREQQLSADEVGKAAAREPAARKEWCEGVIAELNSGRSDIDKPAMMALPIVQYRAK